MSRNSHIWKLKNQVTMAVGPKKKRACLKTKISSCITKKEIETLHLRLNIYDLTSSS